MATTFNDTYEIKSVLGRGGMSTVYLAEHKRLHTKWAVKEVKKEQNAQIDFLAESNILKRLQHPMLPRIVDIFEDSAKVLIVEDFVEGMTLDELLRQQKLVDEPLALQWFRDLCGVLAYLHTQQPNPIIYRDMKPSNIMLQPDGSLKLIDFGIAREFKQESNADTTYVGTKGYAAPEQFGKAQTDERTDIYALGVTMYHLVTGKSPYEPPYQFVPARQLNAKLSHGIEYILNKCVQSEPEARYQNVDELLGDLTHIYKFDKAYQKYLNARKRRVVILAAMMVLSVGLIAGGQVLMQQEQQAQYNEILANAAAVATSDYDSAAALFEQARELYPKRIDADREQAYALYLNGRWQECVDLGTAALDQYGSDVPLRLTVASAQFELCDYEAAAEGFAAGGELSIDNLVNYAVCLGRMGRIDEAEQVLAELRQDGDDSDTTVYVQGEVYYAKHDYVAAEQAFTKVLGETENSALLRRCYISLGDLYRDCAALYRTNSSPIDLPASKAAAVLSAAVAQEGLRYDSVIWEMLAMAYFEAYHTDENAPADYLTKAADCFNRVIELGVSKNYLYANLYTIYYELHDYANAEAALTAYEEMFPDDYMPHALRGMMLITIENQKPQNERSYQAALAEYKTAGSMIKSNDETTYYQQLGSLIKQLKANGWL